MKTAYRIGPKGNEYCKGLSAKRSASSSYDCTASWEDGVTWAAPTMTVEEHHQKANQHKEKIIHEVNSKCSTLTLKPCNNKEKKMLIIWEKRFDEKKPHQLLQLVTSTLPENKREQAVESMNMD